MNKKKIEEFATNARKQLIENLTYEASRIGITSTETLPPTTEAEDIQTFTKGGVTHTLYTKQIEQRKRLIEEIDNSSFDEVIEKIAYTWFNRIIAIRFMEINNYLPTHTRVLSSITPEKNEPDIITEALNLDLNYTEEEIQQIYKYKTENQTDKLFKLLFIKQCNKLNEILPELFETIDDYTEILFNIQLSNPDNIIQKLIKSIPEEDFKDQVEIIGWIYQYYNKELKDETYKNIKKQKVGKDRIPAVTQLFTPDWIVKYMVENSLGRLWIENHENQELKNNWKYYIDEAQQTNDVEEKLELIKATYKDIKPEDIKILDPSMGSGHILVYVFDVLMQIYTTQGYTEKDAVISILENNIYGIDIDDRAYQLAYFAIMMKARSYNRRILNKKIKPNLLSIQETNTITDNLKEKLNSKDLLQLIETFKNGKTLGSITKINRNINLERIETVLNDFIIKSSTDISLNIHKNELFLLKQVINQAKLLNQKYEIVITNPPYMANPNMDKILNEYLKKEYPNTKQDLFSVFMEKCSNLTKINGFNSMITMQSWMFLATYEKLRENLLTNVLVNMIHLGSRAFEEIGGEVVQTVSFTYQKSNLSSYNSIFYRLIDYNSTKLKENAFLQNQNKIITSLESIKNIPDKPFAYWAQKDLIEIFNNQNNINSIAISPGQNITGNNKKYLRYLWEVNTNEINKNNKWVFYVKGGGYRRWAGNLTHVVDWSPEALNHYKKDKICRLVPEEYRFKKGITFGIINTDRPSFRVLPEYSTYDKAGSSIFIKDEKYFEYVLGLLNSNLFYNIINLVNPTVSTRLYDIKNMPLMLEDVEYIKNIVKNCCELSEKDWNDYEISLKFSTHPFIKYAKENKRLIDIFEQWKIYKENQFKLLQKNEILMNKRFAEIYNVNIASEVNDKYVSITKSNNKDDVKSFISYIIGCIFGRYSLDKNGLIFTGGNFNIDEYTSILPDIDNIIPILDDEYFEDDIVNQIINYIKIAFGEEVLEENIDFITEHLDTPGKSSREIIRNYMIKKFYPYHTSMYQKCPIYWLFDSGKENAFKCLIYMHRYEPDLVSRIRFDYLHKTQRAIEDNIKLQDSIINESDNKNKVNKANKKKIKLIKQLDEIKIYDLALAHVANERIEIDLDDGVKDNYAKFQNIEVIDPNNNKPRKINLLTKI